MQLHKIKTTKMNYDLIMIEDRSYIPLTRSESLEIKVGDLINFTVIEKNVETKTTPIFLVKYKEAQLKWLNDDYCLVVVERVL